MGLAGQSKAFGCYSECDKESLESFGQGNTKIDPDEY